MYSNPKFYNNEINFIEKFCQKQVEDKLNPLNIGDFFESRAIGYAASFVEETCRPISEAFMLLST
jgi:hypothetical protein